MSAEAHAPTASEYIVHHLTHWQSGKMGGIVDLSVVNIDSLIFSITLGVLGYFLLWNAARKATSGVPGRFQAAVEILVAAEILVTVETLAVAIPVAAVTLATIASQAPVTRTHKTLIM